MKSSTLAVVAALFIAAGPAAASPCGDRIAALEQRFGAAAPEDPQVKGTAPETTAARLHRQPTTGEVGESELSADSPAAIRSAKFKVMIEQARAADHSGDATECQASANEAEKALGR